MNKYTANDRETCPKINRSNKRHINNVLKVIKTKYNQYK